MTKKSNKVTQKQSVNVSVKIGTRRKAPTRPRGFQAPPTIVVNSHFPQPFYQPPPVQQAPIQTAQTPVKPPTREFATVTEPVAAPEVAPPAPDVTMEEPPVMTANSGTNTTPPPITGVRRRRDEGTGSMTPDFSGMRRPELVTYLRNHPHNLRDAEVRNLRVGEMEELARSLHNNLRIH